MRFVTWNEKLGKLECPYLIRWAITLVYSLRLHHWIFGDEPRAFHDHPSWMIILVLWGGYTDVNPNGRERMTPGMIRFRPATYKHTVEVDKGGCWTLVLFGRQTRNWGFWRKREHIPANASLSPCCARCGLNKSYWDQFPCPEKFVKANKWFIEEGPHPCVLDKP